MIKIIKIKSLDKEFIMEATWSSYLFSCIYIFLQKNSLYATDAQDVRISGILLTDLIGSISSSLYILLTECCEEPLNSEVQKYPTRFENIFLYGKKYKVNYRMSVSGRLAYAIYCLINFIEDAKSQNMDIYVECA